MTRKASSSRTQTMDMAIQKEMESDIYRAKKYLKDNSVVIDVGANVGYFSLFVLRNFESLKVVAIEPHPRNFKLMKENLRDFTLDMHQVALNGDSGTIMLFDFGEESSACHSIYNLGRKDAKPIEVKSITLEELLRRSNISNIDFLKLDCQGAEYNIFFTMNRSIQQQINYIAMEVHNSIANQHETIGKIPKALRKKIKLFKKLSLTHKIIEGSIYSSSVQVWQKKTKNNFFSIINIYIIYPLYARLFLGSFLLMKTLKRRINLQPNGIYTT